jgi:hypothetical protein
MFPVTGLAYARCVCAAVCLGLLFAWPGTAWMQGKPTVPATLTGEDKGTPTPAATATLEATVTPEATTAVEATTAAEATATLETSTTPEATTAAEATATPEATPDAAPTPAPTAVPVPPETAQLGTPTGTRLFALDAPIVETWGTWGPVLIPGNGSPYRLAVGSSAAFYFTAPTTADTDLLISLVDIEDPAVLADLSMSVNGVSVAPFVERVSPTRAEINARIPRGLADMDAGNVAVSFASGDGAPLRLGVSHFQVRPVLVLIGFDAEMPPDWTGWTLTETVGGTTIQRMAEPSSVLNLVFSNTQAVDIVFAVFETLDQEAQAALTLAVNDTGVPLTAARLANGESVFRATLPTQALRDGLNTLVFTDARFTTAPGLAFDWLIVAPAFSRSPQVSALGRSIRVDIGFDAETSQPTAAWYIAETTADGATVQVMAETTAPIVLDGLTSGQALDFDLTLLSLAEPALIDGLRFTLAGFEIPIRVWETEPGRYRVWGRISGDLITASSMVVQARIARTVEVEGRSTGLTFDRAVFFPALDSDRGDAWLLRGPRFPQVGFDGPAPEDWPGWSAVTELGGRAVQTMTGETARVRLLIADTRAAVLEVTVVDADAAQIDALSLRVNEQPVALNRRAEPDGVFLLWAYLTPEQVADGVDALDFTAAEPGLAFDSLGVYAVP